ncbi:protein translation factor SUI1 homolog 2-like isoform X1 [Phoenix dactylifera]|uniref:Protein translation factor SUI1 homolog n=1 Tax=Phoenix dactylifera TaxID=42345 RepID=A0A8B7MSF1_PHODC|nr:protein translation factor SUI1 homolog 2-like isoform X1 [Phoenix dactylifera]XP_026656642.1 protein translation factor SUI1 homolog 2-like isoform X1 [Phoenix dactylifera]
MSGLDVQLPAAFDPFAEANAEDSGAGAKEYVHVRIQQWNGRKSLTTVQGLKKEFSYNKILKDLKKEFCCNGTVVLDPELGQVIQLQGDQRKNVATFLVQVQQLATKVSWLELICVGEIRKKKEPLVHELVAYSTNMEIVLKKLAFTFSLSC